MTTRRKFFQALGFGAGAAVMPSILPSRSEASEAVKKIEASGYNSTLALHATYGDPMPPDLNHHPCAIIGTGTFAPGTRKDVRVNMTVGPDGNLYLKQNGKWARIVTA
jgi:hypothetical protein